ncbi:uncharacterized protein FTOL_09998 [Fusarium torulosum]|uniref:CDR ABC transporter domain-containing protein n=1 Tax=Fusarium torulosum TaxID=33205 RepID=A0AAE8SLM5_9HYPO|nr:uncharacterized protein FTOL_09998 [Fusarium torulosum]
MVNKFAGIYFPCSTFIPFGPGYKDISPSGRAYSAQGAVPGDNSVSGMAYIETAYGYDSSYRWRNFGIILMFIILYASLYLVATKYVTSKHSKGEVLVYLRKAIKSFKKSPDDVESGAVR